MNTYVFSPFDVMPYIILLFILLLINYKRISDARKLKYMFLTILIFACIRYGIGFDYFTYKIIIEDIGIDYQLLRFSFLSRVLVLIARDTYFQVFFILGSLLTIAPVYYVCKKISINPVMSFWVYVLNPLFFLDGMGIVRNAIAFSFILLSVYFFIESKTKGKQYIFLSAGCIVAGFFFHNAAFVGIFVYPIYFLSSKRLSNISLYIVSIILSIAGSIYIVKFLGSYGFFERAFIYATEKEHTGGGTMTYIINGMGIVFLLLWNSISKHGALAQYWLKLNNVGVCLWNILLPLDVILAERVATFYLLFSILLVPYVAKTYSSKSVITQAIYPFFLLFFISSFALSIMGHLKNREDMANLPYQTIFYYKHYKNINRFY